MLQHSFVLDSLNTTGADTFEHFEQLIEEHRQLGEEKSQDDVANNNQHRPPSRLQTLVPTIGVFHTALPLRLAFELYNQKHRLTQRRHIQISFNEIRHILNLAQLLALRRDQNDDETTIQAAFSKSIHFGSSSNLQQLQQDSMPPSNATLMDQQGQSSHYFKQRTPQDTAGSTNDDKDVLFNGPQLITFDGDQTLYSDGANFESNPRLAHYLYVLLQRGVTLAVVTAAGYEYQVKKYEIRLSGLLRYFWEYGLTPEQASRFYLFGGECNYLLRLSTENATDGSYHLVPVPEQGPGGWCNTEEIPNLPTDSPAYWSEFDLQTLLDTAQQSMEEAAKDLGLQARCRVIRKRRSVGLIPVHKAFEITRESLDETVLRVQEVLRQSTNQGKSTNLPYCAFNGGTDAWVDVGNKRVGVQILQSYCHKKAHESLHIGDQFLNTGNDYAARAVAPCIWITNPNETTYMMKTILRVAGVEPARGDDDSVNSSVNDPNAVPTSITSSKQKIDFKEMERRVQAAAPSAQMDVYTGELLSEDPTKLTTAAGVSK